MCPWNYEEHETTSMGHTIDGEDAGTGFCKHPSIPGGLGQSIPLESKLYLSSWS